MCTYDFRYVSDLTVDSPAFRVRVWFREASRSTTIGCNRTVQYTAVRNCRGTPLCIVYFTGYVSVSLTILRLKKHKCKKDVGMACQKVCKEGRDDNYSK